MASSRTFAWAFECGSPRAIGGGRCDRSAHEPVEAVRGVEPWEDSKGLNREARSGSSRGIGE